MEPPISTRMPLSSLLWRTGLAPGAFDTAVMEDVHIRVERAPGRLCQRCGGDDEVQPVHQQHWQPSRLAKDLGAAVVTQTTLLCRCCRPTPTG